MDEDREENELGEDEFDPNKMHLGDSEAADPEYEEEEADEEEEGGGWANEEEEEE
jgi:hypothetical protein